MAKPTRFRDKWRIRWFDEHDKRQSEIYVNRQDALFAVRRHESRVEEIKRGLRPLLVLNKTFDELCDYYLAHRSVLKRRKRDDESLVRVHLRPFFGKFKLVEVFDKVDEYKSQRIHHHPNSLHHQLTLLISMLRVAHEKRWLLEVPNIKKPRVRVFDKDFHFLRTEDEIRRFLLAAQEEGENVFTLYHPQILQGSFRLVGGWFIVCRRWFRLRGSLHPCRSCTRPHI